MTRKIITICTILTLAASWLRAQDRMSNHQISIFVGGQSVPEPSFYNLKDKAIKTKDYSNKLPWNAGFRFERENMVGDKLGWGWCLGGGVRHMGWNTTIPKNTPNTGRTGLHQDEDAIMSLSFMGISGDVGFYASYHPVSAFEVFGSLGVSGTLYWEMGSSYNYGGYTGDDISGAKTIASSLMGPYGMMGVKYTFNEDYFISLSCRYTHGLASDNGFDDEFNYYGPFYGARVKSSFVDDITVMLGVGIMFED